MAVREALHGKSFERKGGFDNHDRHGVCQASTRLLIMMLINDQSDIVPNARLLTYICHSYHLG